MYQNKKIVWAIFVVPCLITHHMQAMWNLFGRGDTEPVEDAWSTMINTGRYSDLNKSLDGYLEARSEVSRTQAMAWLVAQNQERIDPFVHYKISRHIAKNAVAGSPLIAQALQSFVLSIVLFQVAQEALQLMGDTSIGSTFTDFLKHKFYVMENCFNEGVRETHPFSDFSAAVIAVLENLSMQDATLLQFPHPGMLLSISFAGRFSWGITWVNTDLGLIKSSREEGSFEYLGIMRAAIALVIERVRLINSWGDFFAGCPFAVARDLKASDRDTEDRYRSLPAAPCPTALKPAYVPPRVGDSDGRGAEDGDDDVLGAVPADGLKKGAAVVSPDDVDTDGIMQARLLGGGKEIVADEQSARGLLLDSDSDPREPVAVGSSGCPFSRIDDGPAKGSVQQSDPFQGVVGSSCCGVPAKVNWVNQSKVHNCLQRLCTCLRDKLKIA